MIKKIYTALVGLALIATLIVYPGGASAQASSPRRSSPQQAQESASFTNRIIVKYRDVSDPGSAEAKIRAAETLSARTGIALRHFRTMSGDAQVLELREYLPLEEVWSLSEQIAALPDVEYAEPDQRFRVALEPNDLFYETQWHYHDTYGIHIDDAWDVTTGSASTVVAVVDTGILLNHPDLVGRTVPGYDFISDVPTANDGNGRDNDPSDPGDWITDDENDIGPFASCAVTQSTWHGTHVAGTIGANSNNSIGVAGINWKAKLLPVRVLGKCGGFLSDIADGIRWAAGASVPEAPVNMNPAKVINVSIGGDGACSFTYQSAINTARALGAHVVVAAGNENRDASLTQPGNCSGVITVAATAQDAWRSAYSNYGSTVEISAPGGDQPFDPGVLSTSNAGTTTPTTHIYEYYQGTSMAAPHVSGVISLMLARNPYLTHTQVLQILQTTAQPFPPSSNCYGTTGCGAGVVDAAKALAATPLQTFQDVVPSYWAHGFIERLSDAGITGGCETNPVRYCPETIVTRDQMAVFLLRGIHGPSYNPPPVGSSTGFADVSTDHWAAAWIKQLAAEGITGGCGGNNYCPDAPVTRDQMAVFLLKAKHGKTYSPPAMGGTTGFTDVPTSHWAAAWIKRLASEGITGGCGTVIYCPGNPVNRAEMAVFIVKTFSLP
jgi:serine protease